MVSDLFERLKTALVDRYAIDREIGSGGMATVYLAEDLKHHRQVAIKVLRPDLAATLGPERFLREIEVAARLQHPHILPLHDSGEADGFLFYVMPYVEGQSLRDKVAKEGELPIGEAVRILRDVVDALTEAHANNVVHRDIKPENILLRGRHALVTDFGVAKAVSEATGREKLTTAGVALGTPAYMAPEQASADPHLDQRVDIYAVGAVAYELLTGRPVFMGTTPQMILSAHMTEAPQPVTKHRDTVPPVLEQLVLRCLEKKPADRFQSAEELLSQLEALTTPSGGVTPMDTRPLPAAPSQGRRLVPAALGGAAALIVIGFLGMQLLKSGPLIITTSNIVRVTNAPGVEYQQAISPDGSDVAYVVRQSGRIAVRSTINVGSGGESHPGEDVGAYHRHPSWTPDGASVRFAACIQPFGRLACDWKEVGRLGGSDRTISVPRRASDRYAWSVDGTRVAFASRDSIYAYSVDDGEPELLGVHTINPWGPHSLAWSPDGRWIAYVNGNPQWRWSGNVSNASIWLLDADGGEPIPVTDEASLNVSPQWLPDSRHLLFVSNRDGPRGIYIVEVGPDGPRGSPRSVLGSSDPHSISVSADGRKLAYAKFTVAQNIWSVPIPRIGSVSIRDAVPVTTGTQVIEEHSLSPDGEWIAFDSDIRGEFDLYTMPLAGGEPRPVADIDGVEFAPDWSPDGSEIAFYAASPERGNGSTEVLVVSADGGTPEQLTDFPGADGHPDWSPDGLTLAYHSQGPQGVGGYRSWILTRDSVGGPWSDPFPLTDFGCGFPAWAPDGLSLVCDAGHEIVRVSRAGEALWRYDASTAGFEGEAVPQFSLDGSRVYFYGRPKGDQLGVWWIPADGGEATEVLVSDDPSLEMVGFGLTVGSEHLYVTVAEYESDIWVMDLEW